jgi:hypothetical protein
MAGEHVELGWQVTSERGRQQDNGSTPVVWPDACFTLHNHQSRQGVSPAGTVSFFRGPVKLSTGSGS